MTRKSKSRQRKLNCERLEHRIVLSADGLGTAAAEMPPDAPPLYERFGSDEAFDQWFIESAVERWEDLFGRRTAAWHGPVLHEALDGVAPALRASGYSSTNNQVAGVEEGDLVQTNGKSLTILLDREVTIVDATDLTDLSVSSRIELDGHAISQYLDGDRLTVLSAVASDPWHPHGDLLRIMPYYEPSAVAVSVYDISSADAPDLVERFEIDGRMMQSRVVGEFLYIVTRNSIDFPLPRHACSDVAVKERPATNAHTSESGGAFRMDCVYESKAEYVAWLTSEFDTTMVLPSMSSQPAGGEVSESLVAQPADIYRPAKMDGQLVSVMSINVAAADPAVVSSAVFSAGHSTVYVSPEAMYLAQYQWNDGGPSTTLQKVRLGDDGSVAPVAAGGVPGHLLNQYSMDEYQGQLRIGTTTRSRDAESTSGVYVLAEEDEKLAVIGSVAGLAPGERIFAARFMDDEAYLVTFRQIDPLIAIDLSDPAEPRVTGELKITGFSNFLQPVGNDLIVGIGHDVDPEQPRTWGPAQISVFDVSDPENPQLADQYQFGGAWSRINSDPHAVGWYPDYEIFAVPSSGRGAGDWNDKLSVFEIDVEAKTIEFLTEIAHPSSVLRSLQIGDKLVSVSRTDVMVHEMADPATRVDHLSLVSLAKDDAFDVPQGSSGNRLNVLRNDFPYRPDHPIFMPRPGMRMPAILRPIAIGDAVVAVEPVVATGDLSAETPHRPRLMITSVTEAAHGKVEISASGQGLVYTPDEGFVGRDSFVYTVSAADGRTADATVTATVYPVVLEDSQNNVIDVLALVGLDPSVATIVSVGEVRHGTATFETGMEHVLFTPDADYHGSVRLPFTYEIGGQEGTQSGIARIDIESIPDPPRAEDDRFSVPAGSRRTLPVLLNDEADGGHHRLKITELGEPSNGGHVELSSNEGCGLHHVRYRPAEGFVGTETFTYTITDSIGQTDTATVTMEVFEPAGDPRPELSDPIVEFRVELTDENGATVDQVEVGQTFYASVFVQDRRFAGLGVFAAFVDVGFNADLASAGSFEFGDAFPNARTGSAGDGVIDELGAAAGLSETGHRPLLLARIPMVAEHAGRLAIELDPADRLPMSETLVFGISEAIAADRIGYGRARVDIVEAGWQNARESKDVNNDGDVTPMDALVVINELNAAGARPLAGVPQVAPRRLNTLGAEAEASRSMVRAFLDVNGDRHLTSLDALVIINYLNSRNELAAGGAASSATGAAAEGERDAAFTLDPNKPGTETKDMEAGAPMPTLDDPPHHKDDVPTGSDHRDRVADCMARWSASHSTPTDDLESILDEMAN